MKRIVKNSFFVGLASVLLAGCAWHDLDLDILPDIDPSAAYSMLGFSQDSGELLDAQALQEPSADHLVWWQDFERPKLNALIETALDGNFDLAGALARVKQAQALGIQARSALFPQLNLRAGGSQEFEGSESQRGQAEIGGALQWELDLFDRIGVAAQSEALKARARQEDLNALRLALSADVASAYFGAIAAKRTLDLLNQQVATDEELLELLELRFNQGIGINVEVLQQKSRVTDSQALIPVAEANMRVFENRLDVLMGKVPDGKNRVSVGETLSFDDDLPPVGVPTDLLMRRPDLRSARSELIAADADIAAAIADRLPRLTLDGSYVYSDTANFTGPVAAIGGLFVQPLLDWGRRKAEVTRNRAVYEERLAAFTQLYIEAIEDVENTLYQENRQREFIQRLEEQRQILQTTVDETEARFSEGIDDYLPVLNALQELRQVERNLIVEQLNLVSFRIQLHKAVGGAIGSGPVRRVDSYYKKNIEEKAEGNTDEAL